MEGLRLNMQNNPLFYPWGRWGKNDIPTTEKINRIRKDNPESDTESDVKYWEFPNESAYDFFAYPATKEVYLRFQQDVEMELGPEESKDQRLVLSRSYSDPTLQDMNQSNLLDLALALSARTFPNHETDFEHCKCELREENHMEL
jgi:hypothetical protein